MHSRGAVQITRVFEALVVGLGLTLAFVWLLSDGSDPLPIARAASFTVNVTYDENDGSCTDGDCSLRDAIIIANANGEADVITLGSGVHALSLTGTYEDDAATGDLDITEVLTITGLGADQTIIDASGLISDRVFHVQIGADTVVISGVTVLNGNVIGSGGGIFSYGSDLALVNTVVISNSAVGYGGGWYIYHGKGMLIGGQVVSNTGHRGGGVRVYGSSAVFTLTGDSRIAYNVASGTGTDGGGGGVNVSNSARATLSAGQILSNTAGGRGGGVFAGSGGVVTLDGVQILSNTASSGGGVCVDGVGTALTETGDSLIAYNFASVGGGVYVWESGRVTLAGGRILSNTAGSGGGGLSVEQGSGAALVGGQVANNAAGLYGGGVRLSQGNVTIDGGQIVSNTAGRRGGGVFVTGANAVFTQTGDTMIARNTVLDTGVDGDGGGCYFGDGSATLEGGWIISNIASRYGGGVYIDSSDVMLHRGRILDNRATSGGGFYNNGGDLTLVNTTVSGNTATTVFGGLFNLNGTSVLTFTTVASNTATSLAGGIGGTSGMISLQNTLVAQNAPVNCDGTLTSNGYNLDSGALCGFTATGDISATAPLIGPLDADGTHPLLEGSPAIDRGFCLPGITTDQRGVSRPFGAGCDIGAYEFYRSQIYLPLVLRGS